MNDTAHGTFGPLKDIRMIELGVLLAGPFCGQLMADFGAEVIKVEQPGAGDPMRDWGQEKAEGKSLWWPIVARNKKSITLNLRTPEGQQIVKDLVERSDVLLENFRPGTMERWGLGYDVLSKINPRLVMARVSGYGQTGPYAPRAGYASVGEAMGGLRYVIGNPEHLPSRAGISIGDSLAATYACLGILMALHNRETTGKGQVVDSAIYEAVLANMESLISEYQIGGYVRERTGSVLPNVAPSNIYPSSDGMVIIAANQDTVFKRLAKMVGREEWIEDPKFESHTARGMHQKELDDLISDWSREKTADELLAACSEAGVPAGKIYRAPEMLEDPHFAAREAIKTMQHPAIGEFKMQNVFPKLSDTPGEIHWVGPELGEHNNYVYGELLGMSEDRIRELKDAGNI